MSQTNPASNSDQPLRHIDISLAFVFPRFVGIILLRRDVPADEPMTKALTA